MYPLETLEGVDEASFAPLLEPLREQVKSMGLWAAHLTPEYGGQGYGSVQLGLLAEITGRSSFGATVFGSQAPDAGNSELLAVAGNDEQRARWLEPLLGGRLKSAFSMTEPEVAGSDPTLLQTRARKDGADWVIDGHKWFTSNGSVADFLISMVVTDPDAAPHKRASMILVPTDAPGLEIVRDTPTMEDHSATRDGSAPVATATPRSSTTGCGFPNRICSGNAAKASLWPSCGLARDGSSTACAG